jgi:hypothetical protein
MFRDKVCCYENESEVNAGVIHKARLLVEILLL